MFFTWQVGVDQIDKNVVVGLFTWDDASDYNHREIDIEFSRWAQENNDIGQYVIQPWNEPENMKRFPIALSGDYSTHLFDWSLERIFFQSCHGHFLYPPDETWLIKLWTYTGGDIPLPGNENARMNLWLYGGQAPSDGQAVELIVKKFEFFPKYVAGDADKDGKIDLKDAIHNLQIISGGRNSQ